MSMFANAFHSIQIGVEDFGLDGSRMIISTARNVHAGVLLICKERLRLLSSNEEVLLKLRSDPVIGADGKLAFKDSRKKTIEI